MFWTEKWSSSPPAAMASATYQAAPASHRLVSIKRETAGNGLVGIVRINSKTNGVVISTDWEEYVDTLVWITWKTRRIWDTVTKAFVDQYRKFTWTDYIRQDSSIGTAKAYLWANGNTSGGHGATRYPVKGEVKFFGRGRYWALCRTCVVGAWTTDAYTGQLGQIT